jgi:nitroimidazol reductase NimA-like FMN-containing flavoprotein (pyridoxamine 5'-phosphate oxidase superfamily)
MSRDMSNDEIDEFVRNEVVARIGCHAGERMYVVPVAYAFRDGMLYGFSHEGMKLEMMRQNPKVCVEIDAVEHLGSWKSVIAWGTFEELEGEEEEQGASIAAERLASLISDVESRRRLREAMLGEPVPVIYRIRIEEMTGRVEGA